MEELKAFGSMPDGYAAMTKQIREWLATIPRARFCHVGPAFTLYFDQKPTPAMVSFRIAQAHQSLNTLCGHLPLVDDVAPSLPSVG